jgi:hypothetical protein
MIANAASNWVPQNLIDDGLCCHPKSDWGNDLLLLISADDQSLDHIALGHSQLGHTANWFRPSSHSRIESSHLETPQLWAESENAQRKRSVS